MTRWWAALVLLLLLSCSEREATAPLAAASPQATAERVERGRYLALAGNCAGCHTARGGAAYAGGRAIATPFGAVYASNLTPDATHGIGAWSADDFRRALHEGRSRDGRLLYPAFPYPNYSLVTRDDADALYDYLRSLAPVAQANREPELRWPYRSQIALAAWRALYFRPARFEADPSRSAQWNRGAYLVRGLGHCGACHARRNALGAAAGTRDNLDGNVMPVERWYAPSLASAREAGLAGSDAAQAVALLRDGINAQASTLGPMAAVVARSTQHLTDADLQAMVEYLQGLPPGDDRRSVAAEPARAGPLGLDLYATHCADCHGKQGEGVAGIYPALAGNRALAIDPPANAVLAILHGGFAPATAGHPRPFGMPPFAGVLGDAEIAALLTTLRAGSGAGAVSALEVSRYRGSTAP